LQILHLISRLDGSDEAQQLVILAGQQLAAGYRVHVVALSAERAALSGLVELGVPSRVLESRWKYDPIAALRLARVLRSTEAALVHTWDELALAYVDWTLPRNTSYPLIATLSSAPAGPWLDDLVDRSVFYSNGHRHAAVARGMIAEKLLVIPRGVETAPVTKISRDRLLAALDLPRDSWLLAVAGPLTREQQVDEAIWCFELLRTLHEQARLLVFGDGPHRHSLERFARKASDAKSIRFLGFRRDTAEFLAHTDAFWNVGAERADNQPVPLALLHAMASRVPVVTVESPGCLEIIDDGRTGMMVPRGDRAAFARQTQRLLKDPDFAGQLGTAAANKICEQFSSSATMGAYDHLYRHLLDGNL